MPDAPDHHWLLTKVVLSFRTYGACRKDYMVDLKVYDVHVDGRSFRVSLKDEQTPKERNFTITNEDSPFNLFM